MYFIPFLNIQRVKVAEIHLIKKSVASIRRFYHFHVSCLLFQFFVRLNIVAMSNASTKIVVRESVVQGECCIKEFDVLKIMSSVYDGFDFRMETTRAKLSSTTDNVRANELARMDRITKKLEAVAVSSTPLFNSLAIWRCGYDCISRIFNTFLQSISWAFSLKLSSNEWHWSLVQMVPSGYNPLP